MNYGGLEQAGPVTVPYGRQRGGGVFFNNNEQND